MAAGLLLTAATAADGIDFSWPDQSTVHASGPIEAGDAAKFVALRKFDTLELDGPGGLVAEALAIAANIDARRGIRTVVKPGAACASACAMALFVSGATRIVQMGGHLGIHSCALPNGTPAPECNTAMAANASAHGVPWGVIEGFGKYTTPSSMLWLNAEDAECWGLMRWNAGDTSTAGIACYLWATLPEEKRKPPEVTAKKADDVVCRLNAGTSRAYVPSGRDGQGFSDVYRKACERIATDPKTPKYAAIDILLWLTLTDPHILPLNPGTLMIRILDGDKNQISNCWKCLTIGAMSLLLHGDAKDALQAFRRAMIIAKQDTGSVPAWLKSRADIAAAQAEKQSP